MAMSTLAEECYSMNMSKLTLIANYKLKSIQINKIKSLLSINLFCTD